MKRESESLFGEALRNCDVSAFVYKPPDDARNRKPCDFMVWFARLDDTGLTSGSAWFEVKDTRAVNTFNFKELRPAQLQGAREAQRVGIPYWLAVYWRVHRHWTISDLGKIMAASWPLTSITRMQLMSRYGIDSEPIMLRSTLKDVLLGGV